MRSSLTNVPPVEFRSSIVQLTGRRNSDQRMKAAHITNVQHKIRDIRLADYHFRPRQRQNKVLDLLRLNDN